MTEWIKIEERIAASIGILRTMMEIAMTATQKNSKHGSTSRNFVELQVT
jgi:hypothetical protein